MAAEQFGPYRLEALIGCDAMGEVHCAHGASSLDAAHADGLLHCDVNSSNVLLAGTAGEDDFVYQARLRILLCEHARIGITNIPICDNPAVVAVSPDGRRAAPARMHPRS